MGFQKRYSTVPKPGLYGRVKRLVKDYWYIALPVHVSNCTIFFVLIYAGVARFRTPAARTTTFLHQLLHPLGEHAPPSQPPSPQNRPG